MKTAPVSVREVLNSMVIGRSKALRAALDKVELLAERDPRGNTPVLLQGESGTGKDLFARAIHLTSARSQKPFVPINCGAIPEGLAESTLFGHERGASTGAVERHEGSFEQANGGTLFLDEVANLSRNAQVKLLRVLQDGKFRRVDGRAVIETDARIIAATNTDLAAAVEEGLFCEDLYYRIVIKIDLPPLHERPEDIPLLTEHLLEKLCKKSGRAVPHISDGAMSLLQSHPWPGNVRELENALQQLLVFSSAVDCIDDGDVRNLLPQDADHPLTLAAKLRIAEREFIKEALQETKGNRAKAAKYLRVNRSTFYRKMNSLDPDGVYGLRSLGYEA